VRKAIRALALELVVGVALGAVLLAGTLPAIVRAGWIRVGDTAGSVLIVGVLLATTAAVVFRRGGAIRRRKRP
jgi:hypothetical protein